MAIFDKLIGVLGLDTSSWTKGCGKAGDDVDKLDKKTKGFFEGLRGFRRTGLGEAFEVAVGGGALRVFDEAAKKLGEMADKLSAVRKEMQAGNADAGDMVETLAKGIPVFGAFFEAGRKWHDLLSGEQEELDEQNAIIKEQLDWLDRRNKLIQDGTKAQKGFTDELRKWNEEHIVKSNPEGPARDSAKAQMDLIEGNIKAQERYDEAIKQVNKDLAGNDADLKAKLEKNPNADILGELVNQQKKLNSDIAAKQNEIAEAQKAHAENQKRKTISGENLPDADGADAVKALQQDLTALTNRNSDILATIKSANDQQKKLKDDLTQVQKNNATDLVESAQAASKKLFEEMGKPFAEFKKVYDKFSEDSVKKQAEVANENRKKLAEQTKRLTDEAMTPLQKFLAEMKQVDLLRAIGQLDTSQVANLQKKFLKELEDSSPKAERHSYEANTNPFLNQIRTTHHAPLRDAKEDIAKQQLEEQRKQTKLSTETLNAFKTGAVAVPVFF